MGLDEILTPIQFAVISVMSTEDEIRGSDLRKKLKEKANYCPGESAFYLLMGRMERDKLVHSKSERVDKEGYPYHVRIKVYSVTDNGLDRAQETLDFYNNFGD